jgi:hypothetical protein
MARLRASIDKSKLKAFSLLGRFLCDSPTSLALFDLGRLSAITFALTFGGELKGNNKESNSLSIRTIDRL